MSSSLLNYRFGFAIYKKSSKPNLEEIKDWKHISVEEYEVHTHPEVDVQTIETRHGSAVLIGDAFICRGRKEVKDILELMLKKDAWDEFDNITGRFALLVVNKKEAKILHDPFGSRSVYYLQDGEVGISSHTPLLASLFGEKISPEAKAFMKLPEYKMRGTGYLPGDVTMFSNIKGLIPNNYYDLNKRKTYRFWPRHSMKPISVRAFLKECDRYLTRFTSYYASRHNLLLGLTGGVDARALIAGMIANGAKPRLVTWTGNRLPAKEAPIVEEMKEHLGMAHIYMDPRAKVDSEKFKQLSKAADPATGYSRGASGLTGHMGEIILDNEVFIRGWGGEIIRGFYNRHKTPMSGDLCADFFKLYKTKRVQEPSEDFTRFVEEATKGYIERGNYNDKLYNVDVRDLFYWEQRMGMWGANVINEMDPAAYNIIGFNSRPLYEASFGLKSEVRLGAEIMLKLTARYDKKYANIGFLS